MSDYSSNFNNITALQKARQVAAKLQLAGQNNKRTHDEDDLEPHSKRFSGNTSSMSPAHLQQAQQAAAQVAARLGQPPNNYQNAIPNPEAVEKAKQLINKFIPQGQPGNGGGGGGNGGGQSSQPQRAGLGANAFTEIMIPGPKVGLIIGKGGLTIKQLQEKTGAKMIIIQDNPNPEMEKPLRISGDAQNVEHAKQLVYELIQDKGNDGNQQQQQSNNRNNYNSNSNHGAAYSSGNGGRNNGGGMGGGDQIEVFVPKAAVGVVIGKEGGMIKKIQADTGCKLQFLQSKGEGLGDRQCIVQGSKQQVEDGKRMIEDLIDSVLRRNNNSGNNDNWNSNGSNSGYQQQQSHQQSQQSMGGGGGVQVVQQQFEFSVPTSKCGIIIGRGGDTIKQINQQSGAHCEMDRKKSANQTNEKTFSIRGEQHQIDEAKRLIQEKINMDVDLQHIGAVTVTQAAAGGYGQSSQNPYQAWGASGYNQGWDQNQPGQMQSQPGAMPEGGANQPDYSLQWIEYYRSMGMHQQAEAIEAQIKTRGSSGASGAPGMPQGGNPPAQQGRPADQGQDSSQRDYSQEWANYYRQIGKVDEAEAIERQLKGRGSSNPGGNPPNFPSGNYPQQQPYQQYGQQQQQQQYGSNYPQYQQQYHGNGQNSNNDK